MASGLSAVQALQRRPRASPSRRLESRRCRRSRGHNAVLCRQERHVHAKHHVDALKIGFPLSAVPWNCSLQSRIWKRGMRLMASMNRRLALKRSCCGRWITGKLCNEATHLGVLPPARASPCGLRRGLVAKASAHVAVSARRAFREDGGAAPTAPPE